MYKTALGLALAGSFAALVATGAPAQADVIYTDTGLPTYQGQNGYPAVGAKLTDASPLWRRCQNARW